MDHSNRTYLNQIFLLSILLLVQTLFAQQAKGQSGYELSPRPDLWYNDVDGIRIGSIIEGRVAGTHEEGPHRLDAGIWFSTWIPSLPVSYTLTFTEPVPDWSDYGSEFNIQLNSMIRTGYHTHGVSVNKRWQDPFEFQDYWETGIGYSLERRFDQEYALFPQLWSESWKGLIQPYISRQQMTDYGRFNLQISGEFNTLNNPFYAASITASQQIVLHDSWQLRIRGFGSINSSDALPEYLQLLATGPEVASLDSRISRAKGTVPRPWVEGGNIHFSGGANMRGYREQDVAALVEGELPLHNRVAAYNLEFDLPNPVQTIFRRNQMDEFISFRSYLFTDGAWTAGDLETNQDGFFADAGAGLTLSVNIPDYLGRPRGFVIRYEVPFWLSDPQNSDSFAFRHLLGFGATISF